MDLGGKYFASVDEQGVCLLSDIDTNSLIHHLRFKTRGNYISDAQMLKLVITEEFAQCRFSALEGDPTLFVNTSYEIKMLDFEKAQLSVKASIEPKSHSRANQGFSLSF